MLGRTARAQELASEPQLLTRMSGPSWASPELGPDRTLPPALFGDSGRMLPELPRPPTLPELAHTDREATVEWMAGAYYPRNVTTELRGHVAVHVLRVQTEVPVYQRSFYAGGTYEAAFGSPATTRAPFVLSGNAEVHGRAVWSTSTGLAFGAGLGLVLPTASFDQNSIDAFSLAAAAITLRPWDHAFFQNKTLSLRPFVDVHDTVGLFIIQFREALEWTIAVRGDAGQRAFSVATLYLGLRVTDTVALGLEAYQLYIIDAPVADERRAFYSISPSIRMMFPRVQPSIGLVRSIGSPYFPATDSTTAMRAALTLLW